MANTRDLPIYEPQTRLEVTPIADVQSGASQLINAFSNFEGVVNTAETMVAKHVVEGQRSDIRNQIARNYQDFAMNAMNNPDKFSGLKEYDTASDSFAKQYLDQTHFWNKDYAKNMLDYFANAHRSTIQTAALQQTNRIYALQSAQTQNDFTQQIINAIHNSKKRIDPETGRNTQYDEADALIADQYRTLQRDFIEGHTHEDVLRTTIPALTKQYTQEKLIKGARDSLQEGKFQQYVHDVTNSNIPGMTEEEKNSLINGGFKKEMYSYFLGLGINLNNLQDQKNRALKNIENGGTPDTLLMTAVQQAQTPQEYNDFRKKLVVSQAVWDAKQRALALTPAQAERELESYRPTNPNDPNYEYQDLMYKKISNVYATTMNDFFKDPMQQTKQDPNVTQSLIDYELAKQANATGSNLLHTPFNTETQHPDFAIAYYQQRRGLSLGAPRVGNADRSIRFMTDAEAKSLIGDINSASAREKLMIFQQLKDSSANQSFYNARIQQLVRSGMNPQYATMANIDPTSPYAETIVAALSQPLSTEGGQKGLAKTLEESHKDWKKTFDQKAVSDVFSDTQPGIFGRNNFTNYISSLGAYSGGRNEAFRQQMLSTIQNLGYYALLNGVVKNPNDAVHWAESQMTDRYDYTTINGQTIRVPRQFTAENVAAYAKSKEDQLADFPFVTSSATVNVASDKAAGRVDHELIMQGHWANDPLDNGLIWVDKNGKARTDHYGNYFRFSFDDAQNWHEDKKPLYHLEDSLIDTVFGNKKEARQEEGEDASMDTGLVEKTKLEDVDHIPSQSDQEIASDVMSGVPAFKKVDFSNIDVREPHVYNARARGIRNNNPGNIKKTDERWAGEISGEDNVFKTFRSAEDGIRAVGTLLKRYGDRGINTINSIVTHWSTTDRGEYIRRLSEKLGVSPFTPINLKDKDTRASVMSGIIEFENGGNPYDDAVIRENA